MHICILGNGPSVHSYRANSHFDVLIGVNKAVSLFPCNWWCFVDWVTFANVTPIGRPLLFCKACVPGKIASNDPELAIDLQTYDEPLTHEDAIEFTDGRFVGPYPAHHWNDWSGPASLGLAYYLGASRITTYGIDMRGTDDCMAEPGTSRTDRRWTEERELWDRIVDTLRIPVQRITANG